MKVLRNLLAFPLTLICLTGCVYAHPKIDVIDSELAYCRYMIYEARHGDIDTMQALDIIDEVLEVVSLQLKKFEEDL